MVQTKRRCSPGPLLELFRKPGAAVSAPELIVGLEVEFVDGGKIEVSIVEDEGFGVRFGLVFLFVFPLLDSFLGLPQLNDVLLVSVDQFVLSDQGSSVRFGKVLFANVVGLVEVDEFLSLRQALRMESLAALYARMQVAPLRLGYSLPAPETQVNRTHQLVQ